MPRRWPCHITHFPCPRACRIAEGVSVASQRCFLTETADSTTLCTRGSRELQNLRRASHWHYSGSFLRGSLGTGTYRTFYPRELEVMLRVSQWHLCSSFRTGPMVTPRCVLPTPESYRCVYDHLTGNAFVAWNRLADPTKLYTSRPGQCRISLRTSHWYRGYSSRPGLLISALRIVYILESSGYTSEHLAGTIVIFSVSNG